MYCKILARLMGPSLIKLKFQNQRSIQKTMIKFYLVKVRVKFYLKGDQMYFFKVPEPEPEKKGKINFKDYHFQLQDQLNIKPVLLVKKQSNFGGCKQEGSRNKNWNQVPINSQQYSQKPNKHKFQRAIKIPKFEQFLQIEGQQQDETGNCNPMMVSNKGSYQQGQAVKKQPSNYQHKVKSSTLKLPELNKIQLSEEDKINRLMFERKKQIQRAQKQSLLRKTQQQHKITQQRLRLQIQKAQQQQQFLRQRSQLQRKAQEQQEKMLRQKLLLQQKVRLQWKQLKQRQQLREEELRQRQQSLLNLIIKSREDEVVRFKEIQQQTLKQLNDDKNQQIQQIKQQQAKKRQQKQGQIKLQIQKRRRQLELQAQALSRQYENIYKQTIKKIKFNIQTEQSKVEQLQNQIQKVEQQTSQLTNCVQVEKQQQLQLRQQYNDISGRNRAFLLYASHLQTKIDNLKLHSQSLQIKDPSKVSLQLKDSIIHSRKLLNMKTSQHKELNNQIKQSFMRLNISSPQSEQYLLTILENYQEIQRLKQIYFQFVEQEKIIQNKWDLQLQENNVLDGKIRNIKRQMQGNKKKLAQVLNDNLKKLTQLRLHMLKMMYYVPEQKKDAAKYLIQQMLNIQQQNKAIVLDSQNVHSKITSLITQMQDRKRQNEQLSQLLFGAESANHHHFDNMKDEINNLIAIIQSQTDGFRINNLLKVSEKLRELENKLYLEARRQKKIKEQIKSNGHVVPALNTQKNPLVFFGKLLTKKDTELQGSQQQEKILQKKLLQMRIKVQALTDKKKKMNQLLQDYKQRQLRNVRDFLK